MSVVVGGNPYGGASLGLAADFVFMQSKKQQFDWNWIGVIVGWSFILFIIYAFFGGLLENDKGRYRTAPVEIDCAKHWSGLCEQIYEQEHPRPDEFDTL